MVCNDSDPEEDQTRYRGCWAMFLITVVLILLLLIVLIWHGWGRWLIGAMLMFIAFYHLRRWRLRIPQYGMDDVLMALEVHTWKSMYEVRDAMRRSKGIGDSPPDRSYRWPDLGWTQAYLKALERRSKLVESRQEEGRCQACSREDSHCEYRLTSSGLGRKGKIIDNEHVRSKGMNGIPALETFFSS